MAVRKKTEEQQEVLQDVACASKGPAEVVPQQELNYDEWYKHHANVLTERLDNVKEKLKKLDEAMIDKALLLLNTAGDGCGDLRIMQIEKAIEIYREVKSC